MPQMDVGTEQIKLALPWRPVRLQDSILMRCTRRDVVLMASSNGNVRMQKAGCLNCLSSFL